MTVFNVSFDALSIWVGQIQNKSCWKYTPVFCLLTLLFLNVSFSALDTMLKERHQGIPYGLEDFQKGAVNPAEIARVWIDYNPLEHPPADTLFRAGISENILREFALEYNKNQKKRKVKASLIDILIHSILCEFFLSFFIFLILIQALIVLNNRTRDSSVIKAKTPAGFFYRIRGLLFFLVLLMGICGLLKTPLSILLWSDILDKQLFYATAPRSPLSGILAGLVTFQKVGFVLLCGIFGAWLIRVYVTIENLKTLGRSLSLFRFQIFVCLIITLGLFAPIQTQDVIRSWLSEEYFSHAVIAYALLLILTIFLFLLGGEYIKRYVKSSSQEEFYYVVLRILCSSPTLIYGLALLSATMPELQKFFYFQEMKEITQEWRGDIFIVYFSLIFAFLQIPPAFLYFFFFGRMINSFASINEQGARTLKKNVTISLGAIGMFFVFGFFLMVILDIRFPRYLGAFGVILVFLGALISFLSSLEFFLNYLALKWTSLNGTFEFLSASGFKRAPVVTFVFGWLILVNVLSYLFYYNDFHEVNYTNKGFTNPAEKSQKIEVITTANLEDIWCDWLIRNHLPVRSISGAVPASCNFVEKEQKSGSVETKRPNIIPLIYISSSGGGIRAAYWTFRVLRKLRNNPDSPDDYLGKIYNLDMKHVFSLSGISGGALGFTKYIADQLYKSDKTISGGDTSLKDLLGGDYLSPALAKLLSGEVFQLFLPFNWPISDRADVMERAWESSWDSRCRGKETCGLKTKLTDLWKGKRSRENLPLLINNGVELTSGSRLNVSMLNGSCPGYRRRFRDAIVSDLPQLEEYIQSLKKNKGIEGKRADNFERANWIRLFIHAGIQSSSQDFQMTKSPDYLLSRFQFGKKSSTANLLRLLESAHKALALYRKVYIFDKDGNITGFHNGFAHSHIEDALDVFIRDYKKYLEIPGGVEPHKLTQTDIGSECFILPATLDYFDLRQKDIRLSTAALLAARFTYVSPAGLIAGRFHEDAYIVDGGYYDNSGASTNLAIYRSMYNWIKKYNEYYHTKEMKEKGVKVPRIIPVYIQIDNTYKPLARTFKKHKPILQILAPLQTFYMGQQYQMNNAIERARKEFVDFLEREKGEEFDGRFFYFNTFNLPGAEAPLGWILSGSSQKHLDVMMSIGDNKGYEKGFRNFYENYKNEDSSQEQGESLDDEW